MRQGPDFRVVLVAPENPLNVGFAARAMRSFGVSDLVVAGGGWASMPDEARVTGARAASILDEARLEPTLAGALRGCDSAIAFSRRPSALRQQEVVLPDAPILRGRVALVFGRESTGLTRAESALCPYLARIPCRNGVSLNLGQAVAVALFALAAPPPGPAPAPEPSVPLDRLAALWDFLEPRLRVAPRFTERRLRRARQMLYRLKLGGEDFGLLFAVVNELAEPAALRRRRRAGEPSAPRS